MGKSMAERVAEWTARRKPYVCLPPGFKSLRRVKSEPEPKETMEAAGLRIVLDAPAIKLRKGEYP